MPEDERKKTPEEDKRKEKRGGAARETGGRPPPPADGADGADGAGFFSRLRHPLVIAAVIGALAAVSAAIFPIVFNEEPSPLPSSCDLTPGSEARACIETPQTNDAVGRNIVVAGKLAGIPDGSHVWVAIRIGGLYWPKEPEVPIGPAFDVTVFEGGDPPDGEFSIVLLLVEPDRHQEIVEWIDDGGEGLPLEEGMQVLDAVPNLHLR